MNSEHKEKDIGEKFQIATDEKKTDGQTRLGYAERLVNGLASENVRWGMNIEHKERDYLPLLCFHKQVAKVAKLEHVKMQLSAAHYSELKKISPFFKEQSKDCRVQ